MLLPLCWYTGLAPALHWLRQRPLRPAGGAQSMFGLLDVLGNLGQMDLHRPPRRYTVAGPHRIEIRERGYESVVFDVRVVPGETITYHAGLR